MSEERSNKPLEFDTGKMDKQIEFQNRIKKFNDELIPLLKKYRLGLGAQPVIRPDGGISANPITFDDIPKPNTPDPKNRIQSA
ncbi:hypothetical protein D4R42_00190 [bacterium]|nr:MAG: hypothetical protein D4R42_00190 [bacterium]